MGKNFCQKVFLVFSLIFFFSFNLHAQKVTGSMRGIVTDEQGNALPNVSVTLSSPSLMGTLSYLTTTEGIFRFPSLPPGDYTVVSELAGFQTIKRGRVVIHVGLTSEITIQMKPSPIREEIEVMAPSPMVDTKSPKISFSYTGDLINNIPMARDLSAIVESAPGVVSSIAHGGTIRANTYAFDGVNMNDPVDNRLMTNIDFNVIDEVEMILGGSTAEAYVAEGAYINVVTKSGANRFSGSALLYYSNKSLAGSIVPDNQLIALGQQKPILDKKYLDGSASFGGPIVKNKLWFFANYRYVDLSRDTANPDYGFDQTENLIFAKLTYQHSSALKFSGMFNLTDRNEPIVGGGLFVPKESTFILDNERTYTGNLILSWILNSNSYADFRLSYVNRKIPNRFQSEAQSKASYYDMWTSWIWGSPWGWNEDQKRDRIQATASLTRFQDNFLFGDHEFKAGLEFERGNSTWDSWRENHRGYWYMNGNIWNMGPAMGLFSYTTCGYRPGEYVLKNNSLRFSGYIQDNFTIKERLTFNLGLRYDEFHGSQPATFKNASEDVLAAALMPNTLGKRLDYPEAKDIFLWKNFSPRLAATFDIFGNKKAVAKISYARYPETLMIDYYNQFGQVSPFLDMWLWIDANLNKVQDMPGVDLYMPFSVKDISPDPNRLDRLVKKGIKTPISDEFVFGLGHELFKDFSIQLNLIYKEKKRIIAPIDYNIGYPINMNYFVPYTFNDPGWDGKFGTTDDKQMTIYAKRLDAPALSLFLTNIPDVRRKYQAMEIIFNKRFSNNWQFLGSVVWSKLWGNIGSGYASSMGLGELFNHPNYSINGFGRLDYDRPLIIKLQGTVILAKNIYLSGYYRHEAGSPFTRSLYVYFPTKINGIPVEPYSSIRADPLGSERTQASDNFDMRIEKEFNLGRYGKISTSLDLFNVLGTFKFDVNQNGGGYIYADGSFARYPLYGTILSISGQRLARVALKYSF